MNAIHALSQLSYGPVLLSLGPSALPDVLRVMIEENSAGFNSALVPDSYFHQ